MFNRNTITLAAIAAGLFALPAHSAPLAVPETWPYLPQCHQCTTPEIFERVGIDGAEARVSARVTEEGAADYCANFAYRDDPTECTATVLSEEAGRIYTASANCEAGTLVDAYGHSYRVAGTWNDGLASGRVRLVDEEGQAVHVGLHLPGLPLSTQWAVLCPTTQPVVATEIVARGSSFGSSIVGMDHNGSAMWVNEDLSVIYYDKPRAAIADAVDKKQVLYRGDPIPTEPGRTATGTAYTFRKNCEPAPYSVTGSATRDGRLILKGASPVRAKKGCDVVGYTNDSANATLVFTFHFGDI